MSVSVLAKNTCQTTGEGPFWEEATGSLLYVDIVQNEVHRWSTITNEDTKIHLGRSKRVTLITDRLKIVRIQTFNENVSFIIPRSAGGYVVGLGRTVSTLDWDSGKVSVLCEVDQGKDTRFNDAKCDAVGRLWAGTMGNETAPAQLPRRQGSLYSLGEDGVIKQHIDNIDISNGLAWSIDNKIMYFIDSLARQVYAFDYDIASGLISNQRTAVDFGAGTESTLGVPDGMCIDLEGKLWVACYGVGKVVRFDPETGKQLQFVSFPVEKTTSCCFGGPNYSELFVTTGRWGLSDEKKAQQPLAGSVFQVTGLGVRGFAAPFFNG